MNPVVQEETTGCAIASCAAIAGITYREAKAVANSLGIFAEDKSLWSATKPIRDLLMKLGYVTSPLEQPFLGWESLPDCALLAVKWHTVEDTPFWHWVVFRRENGREFVLDSKRALKTNVRTDFGRMNPKWFIAVGSQNDFSRV
ncbi:hypothetical protein BTA51_01080 [Hahella sp. CCB-MM4]|uniref:hypothetical protein n=1 Tax=Hahella sp. (strain CCB-MM4) TaxID=1926491 RepID=UPI000B9BAD66|nr:hypothetical protein [Hahella sp. CCB-MM4]OZG75025.1 hypothetical protein BTA51_01080 [Hahella sp. CCB-MM4]